MNKLIIAIATICALFLGVNAGNDTITFALYNTTNDCSGNDVNSTTWSVGSGSECIQEGTYSVEVAWDSDTQNGTASVYLSNDCSGTLVESKNLTLSDNEQCTDISVSNLTASYLFSVSSAYKYIVSAYVATLGFLANKML